MTEQYKRKVSLVVSSNTVDAGLELNDFEFKFKVKQADTETPQTATLRVYNVSDETAKKLVAKEFTRVVLQAGYETGNYGLIFDGTIFQARTGRESPVTTYVDIIGTESDDLSYAWVHASIAAGANPIETIQAAVNFTTAKSDAFGIGHIDLKPGATLPRGQVLYGMTRDVLHVLATSANSSYFIQNGKVNFVDLEGLLPGEAVVLNSQTGMVGWPTLTQDGIELTCLLNPLLAIGSKLKIDNASIIAAELSTAFASQFVQAGNLPKIDADGLYRLYVIEHEGDTRGQEWYSHLTALSINPDNLGLPSGLIAKGQL